MIEKAWGLAGDPSQARAGKGPKLVAVLNERGTPPRYRFLDGAATARPPTDDDRARTFDLAIALDGGIERTGEVVRAIFARARRKAYVDHHRQGSRESYDVVALDPESASTTELLAAILDDPAWSDVKLDRPLAEALYLGLLSDTGSFQYSLTTPRTHRLAARLLEAGVRSSEMAERVLLDTPFDDLVLVGKVLDRARVISGGRIVVSELLLSMLDGRDPRDAAYDRAVTPLAFVSDAKATILLREMAASTWKLSFRSRGGVDMSSVARELDPGGGGHARAAGCTLVGPLERVRERAIAVVERRLDGRAGGGA
jgi:phosphoesterase RecJ-like protein